MSQKCSHIIFTSQNIILLLVYFQPEFTCKNYSQVASAGDAGSIPGLGISPGGGHGNPLQYSCLENPKDKGAWPAAVHRVAQSWTQLKLLSIHS